MKKIKIHWKSFRFRVLAVTSAAIGILFTLLLFNNIYAVRIVHKQVFETNYRVLRLFMSNVDSDFKNVEDYLVGLQSSANMITAAYTQDDNSFYTSLIRLKKEMEASIYSHKYVEDLFVYFQGRGQYMDVSYSSLAGEERTRIRNMVTEMVEEESYASSPRGQWVCYWEGEQAYLVRILRMKDVYMGSCVKVTTLIEKLREDGFGEMEYLSFCKTNGEEMAHYLPELEEQIKVSEDQEYYDMIGGRDKYMMLSVKSDCGEYGVVALIRNNNILEGLKSFQILIWVLIAALVIFLISFTMAMRRWVISPMNGLVQAMKNLSEGEFGVRIQQAADCEEFDMVNQSFNEMTEQIQTLKINVYEEKVNRQKAELQYMKLQVNPHFYINCLNVIHNLSLVKRNDLIQQMTVYLGEYLRYTMDNSVVAPLGKEIACVESYLHVQELRFPGSIVYDIQADEQAQEVLAPPLLIQTFVENTVKYQVTAGELTHIWIRAVRNSSNEHYYDIEIWDDGDGYPNWVLDCLHSRKKIFDKRGEHYGIYNVRERLRLIYHDRAGMEFCNHKETGGAYVHIILPDDIVEPE